MISEILPELSEEAIVNAEGQNLQQWAKGMMDFYPIGAIHDMSEWGITLQIVSSGIVRCISVVDHEWCLFRLKQIITTFKAAGLEFELDPFTILQPYVSQEGVSVDPQSLPISPGNHIMEVA